VKDFYGQNMHNYIKLRAFDRCEIIDILQPSAFNLNT